MDNITANASDKNLWTQHWYRVNFYLYQLKPFNDFSDLKYTVLKLNEVSMDAFLKKRSSLNHDWCRTLEIELNKAYDLELMYKINILLSIFPNVTSLDLISGYGSHEYSFLCPLWEKFDQGYESEYDEYHNLISHYKRLEKFTLKNSFPSKGNYYFIQENWLLLYRQNTRILPIKSEKVCISWDSNYIEQYEDLIVVKQNLDSVTIVRPQPLDHFSMADMYRHFNQVYVTENSLEACEGDPIDMVLPRLNRKHNNPILFIPTNKYKMRSISKIIENQGNNHTYYSQFKTYSTIFYNLAGERDHYTLNCYQSVDIEQFKEEITKARKNSLFSIYIEKDYRGTVDVTHQLLELISSLNVIEFRMDQMINDPNLINIIIKLLQTNIKIRDLELCLEKREDIESVLQALSENYTIKTVRLYSKKPVLSSTIKLARELKSKRIGVEIRLTTNDVEFNKNRVTIGERFYPD